MLLDASDFISVDKVSGQIIVSPSSTAITKTITIVGLLQSKQWISDFFTLIGTLN